MRNLVRFDQKSYFLLLSKVFMWTWPLILEMLILASNLES